jgi:hypothetical protein
VRVADALHDRELAVMVAPGEAAERGVQAVEVVEPVQRRPGEAQGRARGGVARVLEGHDGVEPVVAAAQL